MSHPWENAIRAFEEQARLNPPPSKAVLFTGSSTITMWSSLAQDFPFVPVINRGFGGSQMQDILVFAERIIASCRPAAVVIYSGDNDLAAGKIPEQIVGAARGILRKIRRLCGNIPAIFIGPKPSPARWHLAEAIHETNELLHAWLDTESNVRYVDVRPVMLDKNGTPRHELFGPDKLHMSRAGYEEWIRILTPVIREIITLTPQPSQAGPNSSPIKPNHRI